MPVTIAALPSHLPTRPSLPTRRSCEAGVTLGGGGARCQPTDRGGVTGERVSTALRNREAPVDAGPGPVLELGPAMSWGRPSPAGASRDPGKAAPAAGGGRAVDTR